MVLLGPGVPLWTFVIKRSEGSGRKLLSFRCPYDILIDVDAKARAFWKRDISINRLERIWTQALT